MLRCLSIGLLGALALLALGSSSLLGGVAAQAADPLPSQVLGLGSSHYNNLIQAWISSFTSSSASSSYTGTVAFDGTLDEGARDALAKVKDLRSNVSFMVTDMPLSEQEREGMELDGGQFMEMPAGLTACVLVYNLPGLSTPLQLSGPLVGAILVGEVRWWNDSRLAEFNPALNATDEFAHPIEVVVRGVVTTTSWQLTDFLTREAPDQWTGGRQQLPTFVTGATVKDDGKVLANYVVATPFTFGYNKYRTAVNAGAALASVQNNAGAFVAPTPAAIQASAATYTAYPPLVDSHAEVFIGSSDDAAAYPLANIMYVMAFAAYAPEAPALPALLQHMAGPEALAAMPAGYIAVPQALRDQNAAAAKDMKQRDQLNAAGGAARPFALVAACALAAVTWTAALL